LPADILEIRRNFAGNAFVALAQLAVATVLGGYLVYALILGRVSTQWWMAALLALALLGVGLYHGRMSFDQRPQVVFLPEGFRDRQVGNILVPWSSVVSGRITHVARAGTFVIFALNKEVDSRMTHDVMSGSGNVSIPWLSDNAREVQIAVSSLDLSPQKILEAAKQFAPHIDIDPRPT
jgi:hypothetical protein